MPELMNILGGIARGANIASRRNQEMRLEEAQKKRLLLQGLPLDVRAVVVRDMNADPGLSTQAAIARAYDEVQQKNAVISAEERAKVARDIAKDERDIAKDERDIATKRGETLSTVLQGTQMPIITGGDDGGVSAGGGVMSKGDAGSIVSANRAARAARASGQETPPQDFTTQTVLDRLPTGGFRTPPEGIPIEEADLPPTSGTFEGIESVFKRHRDAAEEQINREVAETLSGETKTDRLLAEKDFMGIVNKEKRAAFVGLHRGKHDDLVEKAEALEFGDDLPSLLQTKLRLLADIEAGVEVSIELLKEPDVRDAVGGYKAIWNSFRLENPFWDATARFVGAESIPSAFVVMQENLTVIAEQYLRMKTGAAAPDPELLRFASRIIGNIDQDPAVLEKLLGAFSIAVGREKEAIEKGVVTKVLRAQAKREFLELIRTVVDKPKDKTSDKSPEEEISDNSFMDSVNRELEEINAIR